MEKIKIIYEDVRKEGENLYSKVIKQISIPFGGKNTLWLDKVNYAENFDAFVQDAMECGFVYINPTTAITVFQIKSFQHDIKSIGSFQHDIEPVVNPNPIKTTTPNTNKVVKKTHSRRKRKNTNKSVDKPVNNSSKDDTK